MEIRNRTPFVAGFLVGLDRDAAEQLVVCVRGTWSIDPKGRLAVLADPPPLLAADEHVGEPGTSSVRYEADLGLPKPATDCALVGSAVARGGRARQVDVSFRVGPVSRAARVSGERVRRFWLLRWWISPPRAFDRVPLQWELAAGGTDASSRNPKQHSVDLRNPLGRGFRARGSRLPRAGAPLPQITASGGPRGPAGFGFTGGHWAHRRPFAGTYDEAWRDDRCPLLPEDFDERFHNAAAPGLVAPGHLVGGEPVEVRGCTAGGRLQFALPRVTPRVTATLDGAPESIETALNTVTVDTDAMQLRLVWRGALGVHGRFPELRRIDVRCEGPDAPAEVAPA